MHDLKTALLELQGLDKEIQQAEAALMEFDPQLKEVEEPVRALEAEIAATRSRLDEFRDKARRLEQAAEQKRARLKPYEDRLMRVRSAREEQAARMEMDLIRRAADADDQEALQLMEQATRTDLKLDEMQRNLEKLKAESMPRREELMQARSEIETRLAILHDKRQNHVVRLDAVSLRLYERVKNSRTSTVLAPLLPEGACGHCYNVLPLQEQNEIRQGELRRCEACGVILYDQ